MEYILHLSKDKKFKKIIEKREPFTLKKRKNIFSYLCASIISQQLSTKVASVIHGRFIALYGGKEPMPEQVLETDFETLRSVGLSNAKTNYVQNVARFALEHGMEKTKLQKMSEEDIINYLTQIKGVGRWTVEMLLMFSLGCEDVFAVDDLGIQNAMIKLYKLEELDKKELKVKMISISKKWSPYRTYACLHLWGWKDGG